MAQITITTQHSVVITGLPEGLTDDEKQEIASKVAGSVRIEDDDLLVIAEDLDLDLAGDWTIAEQGHHGDITITEAKET